MSLLDQQVLVVQVALCKMFLYEDQQDYNVCQSHIKTEQKFCLARTRAG